MDILSIVVIVLGLCLFETISSIDNAIINAQVLSTMQAKARRWFLLWGIIIAVFLIRGLLPFVIVWLSVPEIGFMGAFQAMFNSSPEIAQLMEERKGIILIGAGVFLLLVYLLLLTV